jgi:hypothetical protein
MAILPRHLRYDLNASFIGTSAIGACKKLTTHSRDTDYDGYVSFMAAEWLTPPTPLQYGIPPLTTDDAALHCCGGVPSLDVLKRQRKYARIVFAAG